MFSTVNIYNLLRTFSRLGGSREKLAAIWAMHITGRRYIGVFIDTVLACNYRCRMCYFSNDEERTKRKSRKMTEQQIQKIANSIFHRTLKLQIGCGAEPTMDMQGALQLVKSAKQHGVPYISMTSNAALLQYKNLLPLVEAGLDELTISLHGVKRDTYQSMMGKTANYDTFLCALQGIKKLKEIYPQFNVRVNYTMNADNVDELADFDKLFNDIPINQLQLRPIRHIGQSDYHNFDLTHVSECLETVIRPLAERCRAKGITVLFPEQINIDRFAGKKATSPREKLTSLFTYINITPNSYAQHDIHFKMKTMKSIASASISGDKYGKASGHRKPSAQKKKHLSPILSIIKYNKQTRQ